MPPKLKPHPTLTLSSFFSGTTAPSQTVPSQLKPTRIFDALFILQESSTQLPRTSAGIPVEGRIIFSPGQLPFSCISFPLDAAGEARLDKLKGKNETVEILVHKVSADGTACALDDTEWTALQGLIDLLASPADQAMDERTVVISGILPPPLSATSPSTRLHSSSPYAHTYLPRLTELSLVRGLYLKLLPPVLASSSSSRPQQGADEWWKDEAELQRVLRLYVTPSIECFGSHRLIYGSQPVPSLSSQALLEPEKWLELIWPVVAEVCCAGERDEAQGEVDAVFGGNIQRILGARKG